MTLNTDQVELTVIEESGVELVVLDAPAAQVVVGLSDGYDTDQVVAVNSDISSTATAASILGGIRTGTPATDINLQLPTGASLESAFVDLQLNQGFSWSVINLAAATYKITVTANDGHTVIGNMAVAAATSGRFLTAKTALNTFVTYRIA